jgi:hypothetical protein
MTACAGSGAMLTRSKHFATDPEGEIKSTATFHLFIRTGKHRRNVRYLQIGYVAQK